MKARELDALIWLLLNDKELDLLKCRYMDGDVQPHAGYPVGHVSPNHYSTDIAAAWKVVEKLERDGWGHKHLVHSPDARCPGYKWTFMRPGNKIVPVDGVATAPLAICLAALKAVGYVLTTASTL